MKPDTLRVLKNPAMGWVMYNEGWELYPYYQNNYKHMNVDHFWKDMDAVNASSVSNILYIRAVWSAFEPQEGKYAWDIDPNFKKLIEGAEKRHLKLAFRVFHQSQDQVQQATPEFVFNAGASFKSIKGQAGHQIFKNPYYDDPVFMAKFNAFVKAFAAKFDNPEITDFVDAYGAGLWGEGHNVLVKDKSHLGNVIDEITGIYTKHFKNVLTVFNLSESDWKHAKSYVFDQKQLIPRRDGLGSFWFSEKSRERINNYFFPRYPLIAEGCYWLNSKTNDTTNLTYKLDKKYNFNSWKDALTFGMEDALNYHANVYDLRVPLQAKYLIQHAPKSIQKFITHGGYRLYPNRVGVKKSKDTLIIDNNWRNLGVGLLPNHHPNWNNKYKLAWGLKNKNTSKVIAVTVDLKANPGDWVKDSNYCYKTKLNIPKEIKLEDYYLVTGIINGNTKKPEIELALSEAPKDNWYKITDINF
ncbi:hypothetical protein [Aestuariibaculum suncheonense]|uniref:DUF4832 domain-containing protein n=1 Tax=Aestuariibaculum suncheonense TaxID=1028745 RepID=A0A8J6UJF6_9FLAO|nr:hypothetical protein [Aestuariibaculum suncheonense]MBD0834751.1 hypothetical protein [Aestuariibaculum suncheonense]